MPNCVIAIDGGQSGTRTIVAGLDGSILEVTLTGPLLDLGRLRSGAAISDCLREALSVSVPSALMSSGVSVKDVQAVYLSLTGGWDIAPAVVQEILPVPTVGAGHDVRTALTAAAAEPVGMLLLAGTGAIAYGRDLHREVWAGGRGYLLGDQGSAYDIGLRAIRAVVKSLDGRGPQTELTAAIFDHFRVNDLDALYQEIYSARTDNARIAALAKPVLQAATAGDAISLQLVQDAAVELAAMVEAVHARLPTAGRRVFAAGGMLCTNSLFYQEVANVLARSPRRFELVMPKLPQIGGAIVEALRLAGVAFDDGLLTRLRHELVTRGIDA